MKSIVAADLHISSRLPYSRSVPEWYGTQRLGWLGNNLVNLLAEVSKCDELILAGDIFHGVPSIYAWRAFDRFIKAVKKPIYIVEGNHDIYRGENILAYMYLPDNVHVISGDEPVFDHDNIKIAFWPWRAIANIKNIDRIKEFNPNLIIGHAAINGADMANGMICDDGVDPNFWHSINVPVLLGHFHKPQNIKGVNYIGAATRTAMNQRAFLTYIYYDSENKLEPFEYRQYPEQERIAQIIIGKDEGSSVVEIWPEGTHFDLEADLPEYRFIEVMYVSEQEEMARSIYKEAIGSGVVGIGMNCIPSIKEKGESVAQSREGFNVEGAIGELAGEDGELALSIYQEAKEEIDENG